MDTTLRFDGVLTPDTRPCTADIAGGWRGEWFIDWQVGAALDAPDETPLGGHYSLEIGDHARSVGHRYPHWLTGRM
ncbi:hypothetical protein [Variovorax sp. EL159]|uniref:hypothetical protein n=1 Tax=Variovorax sp. EL159 TaxID=1566270 RepID=UPI00115F99E0|nr:hypothetical protein [Variovorax sp. EL159]